MTTLTPSRRHKMLVEYAVDRYQKMFAVCIQWLFAGGEIPGLEILTPNKVRAFFESTNPQYWDALMQTNPDEAMSQLIQWSRADPQNDEVAA